MNGLILILAIAVVAGIYWACKFYRLRVRKYLVEHPPEPLFSKPTIQDGGPAYNPDGSVNWESDEMLTGADAKAVLDQALAPYISTPEEKSKYRCPWCGTTDWGSVPEIIFCGKGCGKGSSDPEFRRKSNEAGCPCTTIREWRNPDYPWPPDPVPSLPPKTDTTFSLLAGLFRKRAVS